MEEPAVTPRPPTDPDMRALLAERERAIESLELAADLIAAELALVAVLVHLRFAPRLI